MKDRIKTIRKELNLTQQQFADKLGVRRNTVAQWETGVNQITEQTIKAICTLFDVSEDWLKEGTGDIFITVSRDEEISKNVQIGVRPIRSNIIPRPTPYFRMHI